MSETTALSTADINGHLTALADRFRVSDDEREFRLHYAGATVATTRVALMVAIALTTAVSVMDWLFMPSYFAVEAIPLRAAAVLLPLAFALGVTYVDNARETFPGIATTAVIIAGVATIAIGATGVRSGVGFDLLVAVLTTFYAYLALGLRIHPAAVAGWAIFLAYFVFGLLVRTPLHEFIHGCLMLAASNAIGMFACHCLETNARTMYAQERELRRLARSDNLTGLPDRYAFNDHLSNVWRQARRDESRIAVMLIDIDHFRLFNECYGADQGDECLRKLADVFAGCANRPLDLIARHGGKQFAIVLHDPSAEFVEFLGDKLCERVHQLEIPHKASEGAAVVTVSIGAACVRPEEGAALEQLLRSADDALYEAKHRGRGQAVVYNPEWLEASGTRVPGIVL